MTLDQSIN